MGLCDAGDAGEGRSPQIRTVFGVVLNIVNPRMTLAMVSMVLAAARLQAQVNAAQPDTVVSTSPSWTSATAWRLALKPSVHIGVSTGAEEYQLYRVANALRLKNGYVVVANAGTSELRIYDSGGHHLLSFGSPGDGPGQFRGVAWITVAGQDSLLTWDPSSARLSFFGLDGKFLGSSTVSAPNGQIPAILGAWEDRLLLGKLRSTTTEFSEGLVRDTVPYVAIDFSGDILYTLGEYEDREYYSRVSAAGPRVRTAGVTVPFARNGRTAVAPDGYYFGTGQSYEITYFSRKGDPRRVIRRFVQNRPVTDDIKRQWVQQFVGQSSTGDIRDMQDRMLESVPFPETLPAYRDLLTDDEGNLWVRDYTVSGDEAVAWHVFNTSGEWMGGVRFPRGFEPTSIGHEYVLGILRDELEIEHVQMYDLVKP